MKKYRFSFGPMMSIDIEAENQEDAYKEALVRVGCFDNVDEIDLTEYPFSEEYDPNEDCEIKD